MSLRTYLMLLVVAALVPIGVLAGGVLWLLWQNEQHAQRTYQMQTVREVAAGIDAEIDSTIKRLTLLAEDTLLAPPTLAAFYDRCKGALSASSDWSNISLGGANREQIFNLNSPFGTRLPDLVSRPHIEAAMTTQRATVSDLFMGRTSGIEVVVVSMPVMRDGKLAYVLIATINPTYFRDAFAAKQLPADGILTIFDSQYRAIARSRNADMYVGKIPGPNLHQAMQQRYEGTARLLPRDGPLVHTSWTKTKAGWRVALSLPAQAADAALLRYIMMLALAWALTMLGGFLLAMLLARRIEHDIASALRSAASLASGAQAPLPRSRIRELRSLSDALRTLVGRERAARASAETANRAKDEFLAMLGHELRNPVGAISNAIRVIQMRNEGGQDLQFAAGVIARQTDHLRRLIDDLLDVGRVLTGKIVLERKPLDLALCASEVLATLKTSRKTDAHTIAFDAVPVWVDADPTRIEQVLCNLMLNAITYTPAGGSISLTVREENGDALVEVSDTGIGIDAASLPRVFDLFFQAEHTLYRPRSGLGIGLTLVQRLTELHGGTVSVHSLGAGKGTTFTLRLPALQPGHDKQAVAHETPQRTAPRTILLVEDDRDSRETLKRALEMEGHRVYQAADGVEGLRQILSVHPQIAVIDVGLPGMNGYELARAIRSQYREPVLLIALTGYGLAEDERAAYEAGFDAHLVKPADFARLNALIAASAAKT